MLLCPSGPTIAATLSEPKWLMVSLIVSESPVPAHKGDQSTLRAD